YICHFFFFFFQAEDGIRDRTVTGVQTCALPILKSPIANSPMSHSTNAPEKSSSGASGEALSQASLTRMCNGGISFPGPSRIGVRSEERRVGKEWWCGWGGDQ